MQWVNNAANHNMVFLQHPMNFIDGWYRKLSQNRHAIALISQNVKWFIPTATTLQEFGVRPDQTSYNITDVYTGKSIGVFKPKQFFTVNVNPSSVVLLLATPTV